ncbi:MAG: SulP family inorganic anion transporter [Nitrospira sp.]|nr:SulP family inorganic anion transporter [Nitrospira sp.]
MKYLDDLKSGIIVFIVAVPLCLGIALASDAPLLSGLLAGIVGGMLVGAISGSPISVSGPGASLTMVVAAEIHTLGSFPAFLLAVLLAGVIQIGLGVVQAGSISAFFPTSLVKGLMAAIGLILILKQIPHLFGHDLNPEGNLAFSQIDDQNTFTELLGLTGGIEPGASVIGLASLALLIVWNRWPLLKDSGIPAPIAVVLLGIGVRFWFEHLGEPWLIEPSHLVQVPVTENMGELFDLFRTPDFSQWANPAIYSAAVTIAMVASLASLLNLAAADRVDPQQRSSPPSRELVAQGVGNVTCGMIGGIPVISEIVRSSVNANSGGKTKLATIVHGTLLLISIPLIPTWLNMIPLACLAAILVDTGAKLASPALVRQMWHDGYNQFFPFATTVVAIVLTDPLIGSLIGLAVAIAFILHSNLRRPMQSYTEKHPGNDVVHIELPNQVSFLNRAALSTVLTDIPRNGHVLLDAQSTDYIDPDVFGLIREYKERTGPARGIKVSLLGFQDKYDLRDRLHYVDYSTPELQATLTPHQVLNILREGHERFRTGRRLTRDWGRQIRATGKGQHPLAVVISCIDSRTPAELILDLGLGDIFSIRVAGNVATPDVLAGAEYGCAVAQAKLILVLGHTRCGAVTTAVQLNGSSRSVAEATGCEHLDHIIHTIQQSAIPDVHTTVDARPNSEIDQLVDTVARQNVLYVTTALREKSRTLAGLVQEGRVAVVGAIYNVGTGHIEFFEEESPTPEKQPPEP